MIRQHIVFHGQVQGVGFRYRARHAASLYGCTGWVRNEWDGTVSMEIQGERDAISQVISSIREGRFIYVDFMDVQPIPTMEDEYGFIAR